LSGEIDGQGKTTAMEETAGGDLRQLEERFLEELTQRPPPIDSLLDILREVRAGGRQDLCESWAQSMQEALVEIGDTAGLLRLLALWAVWRDDGRGFGGFCRDVLGKACKDRLWSACVASVGFGEIAPSESLRRLDVLLGCRPGACFLDKTWGFGVVRRVDDFYRRVVLDFTLKPGHALSLACAAESLSRVGEDHLLARRHRDPAAMERLAQENPAEVVRIALRSYGPLSATRLEALLTEHRIVAPGAWKGFWDAARKVLKADPLVDMPARRTAPITLRRAAVAYDAAWFEALGGLTDTEAIMRRIQELEAAGGTDALDDAARAVLADRLSFALKGAFGGNDALYARLALMTRRLKLTTPPPAELRARLLEEGRYVRAAESLPARDCRQMAAFLSEEAGAPALLLADLPAMSFNLLAETLEALMARDDTVEAVKTRCRELLSVPAVPPALLVWVLRNRPRLAGWPLPSLYELLGHALAIVADRTLGGELLRMQHALRGLFGNEKWFTECFRELDGIQRAAIFDHIHGGNGVWDPATRRALLARMTRIEPSLADRKRGADADAPAPAPVRWTSWRSLRERQARYRQLIETEIPRNSRDLAAARSLGDLRENFEYQAARQQQAILLQRREEWERELRQIRGTSFAEADTAKVGMGVEVLLQHADGRRRRIVILGELDHDEALGIMSGRSRLALALTGRRVGEEVLVPGANGEEKVVILAIERPGPAVRAWLDASPSPAKDIADTVSAEQA
jgi:transcription elongation GreA/GreB family factor